jgi:hypothetical protein
VQLLAGRYAPIALTRDYDIAPDGRRFLMLKAGGDDAVALPPSPIIVQHFDEELKRLVPTK